MTDNELLVRFQKEHGPTILALPRSKRNVRSHLFCSDGVHLPGMDRLWHQPLCGHAHTYLPHCDPLEEQWPTCLGCQEKVQQMVTQRR